MKAGILFIMMCWLPALVQAQLTIRIDSIDYSNDVVLVTTRGDSIIFPKNGIPRMLISATISNMTDETVTIFSRAYGYDIQYGFNYKNRYYYRHLNWLDQRQEPEEKKDTTVILLGPRPPYFKVKPGKATTIKFWGEISSERDSNTEEAIRPPIANLYRWFYDVLPTQRVIIYYGYETGAPKILISEPLDLDKVVITTNLTDSEVTE